MNQKNKKKQPESSDANDSFDYDQGFNIDEVYDWWIKYQRSFFGYVQLH